MYNKMTDRNHKVIPYTMKYLSTASIVSGLPYQQLVEDKDMDKGRWS